MESCGLNTAIFQCLILIKLEMKNKIFKEIKQFFIRIVVRSDMSKYIVISSLISVLILVSLIFYTIPKWLIFIFILTLMFQPFVIVLISDRNSHK